MPQSIQRLSLDAFRNYDHVQLTLQSAPIILVGDNGAGKTNLLEAISLLSPGRGLRRAGIHELLNKHISRPWALAFAINGKQGDALIGIGADPQMNGEKRILRIDGKPARSQTQLAEHIHALWLTPDMDRLLCDSASERRRFLDRMTYALDPAHVTRVNRYEDAMRQRLKLLRDGVRDAAWMTALEDTMARDGIALAVARLLWREQISLHLQDDPAPFPRLSLHIEGAAEKLAVAHAALDAEDHLRMLLAQNRNSDAESGMTHIGPHRSDVHVTHLEKNALAEQCSTGEQKALLISLVLAQARLLTHLHGSAPLILLDDVTAHLDEKRRAALCQQILALGAQAWLSGTDARLFPGLKDTAQFFEVREGNVMFAQAD